MKTTLPIRGLLLVAVLLINSCNEGGEANTGPDTTSPDLVWTYPSKNAINVPVGTDIKVRFSEPMDASTINTSTFTVTYGWRYVHVIGTVSYEGYTATFTPLSNLPYNELYHVTVSPEAKDLQGNVVKVPNYWSFETPSTFREVRNGISFVIDGDVAGNIGDDDGNDIAVDSAGKILVAGYSSNYYTWIEEGAPKIRIGSLQSGIDLYGPYSSAMVIWRYNPDGSLDDAFNGTGFVTHRGAAGGDGWDIGNAVTIDDGGKILVAGQGANLSGGSDMVIWRYNPDGTLDSSFHGKGVVIHHGAWGSGDDRANAIAVDGSGRIIVAGAGKNSDGNYDMVIWRYTAEGTLDTTFNGSGYVIYDGADGEDVYALDLAINSSGKILVTGHITNSGGGSSAVVWRYNPSGEIDTAFNGRGWILSPGSSESSASCSARSIILDSFGRIVVAGASNNLVEGASGMTIWRYAADGSLDTTFSGTGYAVHDIGAAEDIAFDASGRILVTGSHNAAGISEMVIWRYTPDGVLDETFNGTGYIYNAMYGRYPGDFSHAIATDTAGNIFVSGRTNFNIAHSDMAIWKY